MFAGRADTKRPPQPHSGGKLASRALLQLGVAPLHLAAREVLVAAINRLELAAIRACLLGCAGLTGIGAATRIADIKYGDSVATIDCGAVGLHGKRTNSPFHPMRAPHAGHAIFAHCHLLSAEGTPPTL